MAGLIPKKRRGRPKRQDINIGPTPETTAKLVEDQLSALLRGGCISPDHERAGRRLHSFSLALQRGMSPRSRLQAPASVSRKKQAQASLDRLSEAEQEQWDLAYKPWANSTANKIIGHRPKLSLLSLVFRIVDENQSPKMISESFGLKEAAVVDALRDALERYIAQEREKKHL